jgi:hypothetical protein
VLNRQGDVPTPFRFDPLHTSEPGQPEPVLRAEGMAVSRDARDGSSYATARPSGSTRWRSLPGYGRRARHGEASGESLLLGLDPALGTHGRRRRSPSFWGFIGGPVGVPSTTENDGKTAGSHANENALLKAQIAPSPQVRREAHTNH